MTAKANSIFGRLRLLQGIGKVRSPDYFPGSFFPYLSPFIGLKVLKMILFAGSELVSILMILQLEWGPKLDIFYIYQEVTNG